MEKKVTIRDVAKYVGVSVASVSYALNGVDKITPETKARIEKAMEELDYKPSMTARSLSSGDSKLIGVTLPITEKGDVPGTLLDNPFFGEFISGIEYVVRSKGYDILISGVESNKKYKDWIRTRGLDGIIMLGMYPKSMFMEIQNLNIPIVLTDAYEDYALNFHRVMLEDELGGYMATKYLLEQGHKNIGIVTGNIKKSQINYRRYLGYKRALDEASIKADDELYFEGPVNFDGGHNIGMKLLKSRKATAIFAVADIMAIGLMKAFLENGKMIPRDLSIMGFDNIQFGKYVTPGLTTIKQDIVQKGMVSAEMVLKDIAAGKRTTDSVVLQPELVIRDSVASIKSNP